MSKTKPSTSYLDLKDQSNRDIRETMAQKPKSTPTPPPRERLDNPKRRLKSVIHRVPQGSSSSTKENRPPPSSTTPSYRPTLNSGLGPKIQDIRERPDYRPTLQSKWPPLYGTRENHPVRAPNSASRKLKYII